MSSRPDFLILWLSMSGLMALSPVKAACIQDPASIQLSPRAPNPGEGVRIKVVAVEAPIQSVQLKTERLETVLQGTASLGGPPFSFTTRTEVPLTGTLELVAELANGKTLCRSLAPLETPATDSEWTVPLEAFYSAWIEQLFEAPVEEDLSARSLEPLLRDPDRNFLYNALSQNEDQRLPANPDCADLPYFLRSYFAWKVGLPMSYRSCDRGTARRPPQCGAAILDSRFTESQISAQTFTQFSRKLNDTVHSGSARTAIDAESTDFYPVSLDRRSLWPGTVYADPYGHTLIIAQWVEPTRDRPGILFAADAQPDHSVTRKRFWEGNFLFANLPSAGPGFKAFRPIRTVAGRLRQLDNEALSEDGEGTAFDRRQADLTPEAFYATLDRAIQPGGLDPVTAYESRMAALLEQVRTRDTAVQTAERYLKGHPGSVIAMPNGAAIFETTGPWEDFASPSRDLRLLIALSVIERLPDRVRDYPDIFVLKGRSPEEAARALEAHHLERLKSETIEYTQSDGRTMRIPLSALFERRSALEIGYNPNDCPERRWGAPAGSAESAPCRRLAPSEQQARMENYRSWFRSLQRPPRP